MTLSGRGLGFGSEFINNIERRALPYSFFNKMKAVICKRRKKNPEFWYHWGSDRSRGGPFTSYCNSWVSYIVERPQLGGISSNLTSTCCFKNPLRMYILFVEIIWVPLYLRPKVQRKLEERSQCIYTYIPFWFRDGQQICRMDSIRPQAFIIKLAVHMICYELSFFTWRPGTFCIALKCTK